MNFEAQFEVQLEDSLVCGSVGGQFVKRFSWRKISPAKKQSVCAKLISKDFHKDQNTGIPAKQSKSTTPASVDMCFEVWSRVQFE